MSLTLALVVAVLFGVGTFLLLQRTLTRVIFGLGIMGHGANLLLQLAGGRAGQPPVVGENDGAQIVGQTGGTGFVDPLPQALALTAIVISFGVTAYLLAMAYRSWVLNRTDVVEDDVEDRRIARSGGPDTSSGVRARVSEPAGGDPREARS
jgi:multicomponent Na+:H+ antiporter subunit C